MEKENEAAAESLKRLREFKVEDLVQKDRLGENSFEDAIEPAQKLQRFFRKVPVNGVPDLSKTVAKQLLEACNAAYSHFDEILHFNTDEGHVSQRRQTILNGLKAAYDQAFDRVHPIVSFSVAETADFDALEQRGRAAVQKLVDETNNKKEEIDQTLLDANALLEEVRNVAAQEGVLKQAAFFKAESEKHETASKNWLIASIITAALVIIFTGWTLLFAKAEFFSSSSIEELLQIAISKVLFFSVLAFLTGSCIKMYRSNLHNAVVNKHRQNALMTYTTLSEAGATPEARDTILNHAAAAIYAPVDTGYVRNEERGYGASLPAVALSPKPSSIPSE